jgi:hypothetical protein
MGAGADERAVAAQSGALLSARQVRDLILAASRAYQAQRKLGLADEPFDAWRKAARPAAEDERRRARWALARECRELAADFGGAAGAEAYAAALLERIHKTTADRATAKQCWQVVFTLRNRAAAKRRNRAGTR